MPLSPLMLPGEEARQVVADRQRQEPAAHREARPARSGASLVTIDKPDRRQAQLADASAARSTATSGQNGIRPSAPTRFLTARYISTRNASAVADQARGRTCAGSTARMRRLSSQPQASATSGASSTIASGLTDWNQPIGNIPAAEQVAVDDVLGEEVERAAGLLEEHPEQHVEGEDDQHRDHAVALHAGLRAMPSTSSIAATHDEQRAEQPLQAARADLRQQQIDDRHRDEHAEHHPRPRAIGALRARRAAGRRRRAGGGRTRTTAGSAPCRCRRR